MRRSLIVLLLMAIVGGIAWWLFDQDKGSFAKADPWRAMPLNTAVIIEVPAPLASWESFTSTSQLWTAWDSAPGCAALNAMMLRLRGIADSDPAFRSAIDTSELLIAFAQIGEEPGVLVAWPIAADRMMISKLGSVLGTDLGASSSLWHDGAATARPDSALPAMQLAYANGLLLLSDTRAMLDDALEHVRTGSALASDTLFNKARGSLGAGSDAHILLNVQRAQRLLTTWFLPQAFDDLQQLDGWAAVDLRLRPEAALYSGLLFTSKVPNAISALRPQSMGRLGITRMLPPDTRSLEQVSIADAKRFSSDALGVVADAALFNAYAEWAHGAAGIAIAGTDSSTLRWAILQADDPQHAVEALTVRCSSCDTLGYRGVRITRSADTSALASVWGPAFEEFERPWWCLLSDKVIFSDQIGAMRASIDAWTDGSSLAQDAKASGFFQRYATDAGFTWWSDAVRGLGALRSGMKERGARELDARREAWQQLGGLLLQLSPDDDGTFQITGCLSGNGASAPRAAGGMWSVAVGAPITCGPFLLTDHLSRTQQIVVQDKKQRIALISCTGKILWQREVDGPIIGTIRQVDRFKNGKLQMLFNTAARVYLIDRNGKDVDGFPISLPEQASAPLSVFDYDGKKEYRVLIPTVEAHLLNYGMDGRAVQGWDPPHTPATCDVPVQHVRIGGKDYLVLIDHAGSVTVLDRRGVDRYQPKLKPMAAARIIGLQPALDIGACSVLWADSAGNGLSTSLDGHVDTLTHAYDGPPTKERTPGIGVLDMDNDGTSEVVRWIDGRTEVITGALAFPAAMPVAPNEGRSVVRDINLDGALESVTAFSDGRIVVQRADP